MKHPLKDKDWWTPNPYESKKHIKRSQEFANSIAPLFAAELLQIELAQLKDTSHEYLEILDLSVEELFKAMPEQEDFFKKLIIDMRVLSSYKYILNSLIENMEKNKNFNSEITDKIYEIYYNKWYEKNFSIFSKITHLKHQIKSKCPDHILKKYSYHELYTVEYTGYHKECTELQEQIRKKEKERRDFPKTISSQLMKSSSPLSAAPDITRSSSKKQAYPQKTPSFSEQLEAIMMPPPDPISTPHRHKSMPIHSRTPGLLPLFATDYLERTINEIPLDISIPMPFPGKEKILHLMAVNELIRDIPPEEQSEMQAFFQRCIQTIAHKSYIRDLIISSRAKASSHALQQENHMKEKVDKVTGNESTLNASFQKVKERIKSQWTKEAIEAYERGYDVLKKSGKKEKKHGHQACINQKNMQRTLKSHWTFSMQ